MQLGIRFHDVKEGTLEERIQIIKEQGFDCTHIALGKAITEYSVRDAAYTPGYANYLRKTFEKYGIDVAVLGNYLNLATPDEEELKKSVHRYMAHIRLASILNAGVVGTETGAVNKEYKFEAANRSQEALDLFTRRLEPVVEYAEKMGVIVAIEPVARHIVYDAKRARYVLDRIASPNLQIIFDPVNMVDMDNYERRHELFDETMDLLCDDIAIMHIKDFVIKDNDIVSVPAGEGMMDYKEIMKFLKAEKPFIYATLEDTKPHNAVKSKEYIQRVYDEA